MKREIKTNPFPTISTKGEKNIAVYEISSTSMDVIARYYDSMSLDELSITFKFDNFEQFRNVIDSLNSFAKLLERTKYCFWTPPVNPEKPPMI